MKKFIIQIVALLLAAFTAIYVTVNPGFLEYINPPQNTPPKQTQVKIGVTVVNIEVADNQATRAKGLGGRDSLASDSGMLFIFPDIKKHRFWMKGMKFSLDFIFIQEGKVVDLIENIPPPAPNQADPTLSVYEPAVPVNMMIETNAGFATAHGIKVGDNVFIIK